MMRYLLPLILLAGCAELQSATKKSTAEKPAIRPSTPFTLAPHSDLPPGWYRGNLHTHSLWSDGDDFPERIARWYRDHNYQFLGISDHNNAQTADKWVKYADLHRKGLKDQVDRFLADASYVQTRGDKAAGNLEIRLTPFDQYKPMLDQAGAFLLIQSEEISDKVGTHPIHINATNVRETIKAQGGATVVEAISNNLRAIREQAQRLNRPILPHLNHPNFEWGVTAQELAEVVEEHFFEIFNGHPSVRQPGDETHPSVEQIWDIANTLRMTTFKSQPLKALATDDAHNYHFGGQTRATPGRGWICVRAKSLSAEGIIAAMEAGDFYASSGVILREVRFDRATRTIQLDIQPDGDATFSTQFIGTLAPAKPGEAPAQIGATLKTVAGLQPSYQLSGNELYVRALVTSSRAHSNPSLKDQKKQAWTQPVVQPR